MQNTQNFAMFSDAGNAAVGAIVKMASEKRWTWERTEAALYQLSGISEFEEATDTAVREVVYCTLGFNT